MVNFFSSILENLQNQDLQVRHQNILVVMMMVIGKNQEDQNQDLREGRERNGTDQDPSIRAGMKKLMVLCLFQDSLGTQKING